MGASSIGFVDEPRIDSSSLLQYTREIAEQCALYRRSSRTSQILCPRRSFTSDGFASAHQLDNVVTSSNRLQEVKQARLYSRILSLSVSTCVCRAVFILLMVRSNHSHTFILDSVLLPIFTHWCASRCVLSGCRSVCRPVNR